MREKGKEDRKTPVISQLHQKEEAKFVQDFEKKTLAFS